MGGRCLNACQQADSNVLRRKKIENINLATCNADGKKGMIMEVDLEYPSSLHKLHNDYPLAAEKIRVNREMLSPYCEMIRHKYWASIYLLLVEFSVRAVNYGPSFFPSIYGPSAKRAGHKSMEKKKGKPDNRKPETVSV